MLKVNTLYIRSLPIKTAISNTENKFTSQNRFCVCCIEYFLHYLVLYHLGMFFVFVYLVGVLVLCVCGLLFYLFICGVGWGLFICLGGFCCVVFFFSILLISIVLLEACQINQFAAGCLACFSWKKGTTALWGCLSISISVVLLKIEKNFSQFFWGKCVVFRVFSVLEVILRDVLSTSKWRKWTGVPLQFKKCHPLKAQFARPGHSALLI